MIKITGSKGQGYRFFYPWHHRTGGSLSAIRMPNRKLLSQCILVNASIICIVETSHLRELTGHPSSLDGWIYLGAFMLLLIELAWKIRFVWHRVRIETPTLAGFPASSQLRAEHTCFWLAMQVSLIALIDHDHPTHGDIWLWTMLACLLMIFLPTINNLLLRFDKRA